MNASKKILITGGCGFIGLNLVDYLISKTDWDIFILDNLSVGRKKDLEDIKNYSKNRISFYKGDILNKKDVEQVICDCDFVVHLAAQTDVIFSVKNPVDDARVNILGLLNLLNASVEHKIKRFVFASSAAPLGEQDPPVDESKVPSPMSPYGASKLAGEGYCSSYSASFDLSNVVLRFSNVYGLYSFYKGSVIAKFIRQILLGEQPIIFGDGNQTRDFIFASDIAKAVFLSLTVDVPNINNLYQIGTGVEVSINDLYTMIKKELEKNGYNVLDAIYKKPRKGEIYRNFCSINKAKNELDFKPSIKLEEGIEKTVNWFLKYYKKQDTD